MPLQGYRGNQRTMSHPYPKGSYIVRNGFCRKILEEFGDLRFTSGASTKLNPDESWKSTCGDIYHIKEIKRLGWIEEKEEVEQVKVKYSFWKPEEEKPFYYISSTLEIYRDYFCSNRSSDQSRIEYSNCFKTEEEALAALERVKKALRG